VRLSCPACRKLHEHIDANNTACPRCGCDLARLRAVRFASTQACQAAAAALRCGQWSQALDYAEHAWWLSRHSHAAALAALACGALGQPEALLSWRRRAGSTKP
jgi:hypothetical protein